MPQKPPPLPGRIAEELGIEEPMIDDQLANEGGQEDATTPDPQKPTKLPEWMIGQIIPNRQVSMLSGSSGAGKTSWIGWFVAQLLKADELLGGQVHRPPFVAYLAGDRVLDDAMVKFKAAGWEQPVTYGLIEDTDAEDALNRSESSDRKTTIHDRFPVLSRALEQLRRENFPNDHCLPLGSLLIIDGMSVVLGIEPTGAYLRNVALPLVRFNRFVRRMGYTVLLIHHGGKQIADAGQRYARAQDRILGSMALQGFTSTQIQLTEPELTEEPRKQQYELTVVSHSAPKAVLVFVRRPDGAFELVGDREADVALNVVSEGAKALLEMIPDGGIASTDLLALSKAAGNSRSVHYKYIKILKASGLVEQEGDMLYRVSRN